MIGVMVGPHGEEFIDNSLLCAMPTPTNETVSARGSAGAREAELHSRTDDVDGMLARRCQTGDVGAFGLLVQRHEKKVYALVARILGQGAVIDDIEDTVQDVFLQAWRAFPRFRGDAKFSTWLYRIATNMAIKQWHRRKRHKHVVNDEDLPEAVRISVADPNPGPEEFAQGRARDTALRSAIDALPEKQRTVLLLHYFEDYSCEEVAALTGCSVGTVWSRLHYACKKLRGTLEWMQQ
ncbi:MAG: RNA polymerase sigma factor [Capsulimonadaceae bacterium]